MATQESFYCEKCNRTMNADQFYGSNNLVKYPEGKMKQCKKCMTMHVDNFNPDTYLWILQECDVPYVPEEWNKLLASYARDKSKLTGMTVLGRYLSKMKLKQFKEYRWKDTEFLQELANNKIEQTMKRQGYEAAEIAQAIATSTVTIPQGVLEQPIFTEDNPFLASGNDDYFAEQSGGDDFIDDLTEEDRTYLRLKWGKTYKPEEWIRLEQLYEEMMGSYDVQGAGHIDTLKLVCKTSLKANQLIDIGDIEGFQKMSKVYDSLMKSGKFTAAQNKAESGEFIDSIGELVALCEKEGFIPRYYIDEPNDKVDRTLQDLQSYTRDLINEETNLSSMIEHALREIEKDKENEAKLESDDGSDDEDAFEAALFEEDAEKVLRDEDFTEFSEYEEGLEEDDEAFLKSILGDE
jgi:hypothetical protein